MFVGIGLSCMSMETHSCLEFGMIIGVRERLLNDSTAIIQSMQKPLPESVAFVSFQRECLKPSKMGHFECTYVSVTIM